jgi:hypothetical protein
MCLQEHADSEGLPMTDLNTCNKRHFRQSTIHHRLDPEKQQLRPNISAFQKRVCWGSGHQIKENRVTTSMSKLTVFLSRALSAPVSMPMRPRKKEGEDCLVSVGCLPFSQHQDDYQPDDYDCYYRC